jgi:peptidoglycan hydrolase-like protein with peptidoglycan-binding domain
VQPLTGYTPSQDLPLLAKGKKGDEVLWMQEHLAAADPTTPMNGVFDAATDAALRNFQTQRGLQPTGQTDAPTWPPLLALTPVQVMWTSNSGSPKGPASARAASRREIPVLGRH